jgi:hypothetical protein
MDIKSADLSARLLATENLSVQRAPTRTASFDVKSRVLTLPLWKDMTPEIEDMLVGHEVGHALYTTEEYFGPIKENPKMMTYLNVLEDVRIEKLIKRKYPGLRKRMNEGYKQLNDRDFFGVKQVQNLDDLLLIDKINLYFKAGFSCGVEFTPEEKQFANRAERTETVDEVITLAQEVWAYSKQQLEEKKKKTLEELTDEDLEDIKQDAKGEFDDNIDYDDFEESEDEDDQDLKPVKQKSSNEEKKEEQEEQEKKEEQEDPPSVNDQELESKTERVFSEKLQDLADETTEYLYHEFDKEYYTDPVIGYKTVLNETKAVWLRDDANLTEQDRIYIASENSKYEKFKAETTSAVNYLVKEFEMRKSAALYKRAQVSKSGTLDMKRIWSYKLQDDLFKRVTVLPQGKNHGMLFLLDWSGSMDGVIEDTLKQVINLAMFCTRINIPYRVLAFTSQYHEKEDIITQDEYDKRRDWVTAKRARNENKSVLNNVGKHFNMIELFSSKMSTSEFHSMAKRVLDRRFQWNRGYAMGGTPLNEALVWMYFNIDKYIKQNAIEKLTLITLTDGEGGPLYSTTGDLSDQRYVYGSDGVTKKIKQKHFIRDEFTQKTYELFKHSGPQTETYLRMIKDRHNITLVGFYICRNARGDLQQALHANLPSYNGNVYSQIESWRKDFRNQGFASIKNTGRDDLFLIPKSSTKIVEGEMDIKADANAKVIARDFSKFLNVKKTSRVLLNQFVEYVA